MTGSPPINACQFWAIAMLYAGVFLNAGLLESVAQSFRLVGHLTQLCVLLLGYGTFLGLCIFYVPARFSALRDRTLEDMVAACLGPASTWLFGKVILPVWAVAWFAYNTLLATIYLDLSLFHKTFGTRIFEHPGASWRQLAIPIIWFVVVAPAVCGSLWQVARSSLFMTKVSFVVIIGLALSSRHWVVQAIQYFDDPIWTSPLPLASDLILWAAPPLLLAGRLTRGLSIDRRGLLGIIAAGVIVPILFAVTAALLTIASAGMDTWNVKSLSYWGYAYRRPHQLGWVKLLLVTFTVLTASRFSANVATGVVFQKRSWKIAAAATLILLIIALGIGKYGWIASLLQYAAIPFTPLAGVLCAAYLSTHREAFDFGAIDRRWSLLAWAGGCTVTAFPMCYYPESMGTAQPWVFMGWLVSFAAAYIPLTVRARLARRAATC